MGISETASPADGRGSTVAGDAAGHVWGCTHCTDTDHKSSKRDPEEKQQEESSKLRGKETGWHQTAGLPVLRRKGKPAIYGQKQEMGS